MAIEDGAALGFLMKGSGENDIVDSLIKFEKLRSKRAARVQILSSVRAGREPEVQEKLTKYLDSDVTSKWKCGWISYTNACAANIAGLLTCSLKDHRQQIQNGACMTGGMLPGRPS